MSNVITPSRAVSDTVAELVRASARFADAAAVQFAGVKPKDYAELSAAFEKGLAEMVVVVALNPGNTAVQLCADVGATRHVLLTVPVGS